MSKPADLMQGTLDMLLLKILALGPMNGFAVSQRLKLVSGDVLQVSDGSLYPALHKLEQEGWITAEWKTSEYGRRAKYYSLTRLGRRQLEKEEHRASHLRTIILKKRPRSLSITSPPSISRRARHFSRVAIFQHATGPAPASQSLTRPLPAIASETKTPPEGTSSSPISR
jgi:PadR family transcriptional regulator, regulatory protein PadR